MKTLKEEIINTIRQNPFEIRCDDYTDLEGRADQILALIKEQRDKLLEEIEKELKIHLRNYKVDPEDDEEINNFVEILIETLKSKLK